MDDQADVFATPAVTSTHHTFVFYNGVCSTTDYLLDGISEIGDAVDGTRTDPMVHWNNDSSAGIPVNYTFHPNLFTNHVQLLFPSNKSGKSCCYRSIKCTNYGSGNREVNHHTCGFRSSKSFLPLILSHRDQGKETYVIISVPFVWTVFLAFQNKIKKPRPKGCRGFQNIFRIVMGSKPAYSPLIRHGDEIIIAVK
jgi:hypothetical protein